jgi:hypothetical protein
MYNNGFPVTYPQLTYPFQQQQQLQPQGMTPPTIHADIVQVETEQEAWNYPVAAGSTQMMIARDDSAIFVKSAFSNSQPTLDIYRKEPQKAAPDPAEYVTKEELAAALEGLKRSRRIKEEPAE